MLERVRAQNGTAVYYAYVIAMLARHAKGIKDCDVGSPSLCVHGADFVREYEPLILSTYDSYANRTAAILGRMSPVVWLMEPDWHQYGEGTQRGGGLSRSHMLDLFIGMVHRIRRHLPASRISLDISPWVTDIGEWMGARGVRAWREKTHGRRTRYALGHCTGPPRRPLCRPLCR